jgi:hypothetical protein
MRPTPQQIAEAAYSRWERRGYLHGFDCDDWVAVENDLVFGLNYRYVARLPLSGPTLDVGKAAAPAARRCRFCERAEPAATFRARPLVVPGWLGNAALVAWDECDDCRAQADAHLAGSFERFAAPWVAGDSARDVALSPGAWKALVRMGLSVLPAAELHHFDDTIEWVSNPDHSRDAVLLEAQGCQVYATAHPLPAPFAALARRAHDESPWPYMLFFLGSGRAVFQTHLPLCPRDEDQEEGGLHGPVLSMSTGTGPALRAGVCRFVPVERNVAVRGGVRAVSPA